VTGPSGAFEDVLATLAAREEGEGGEVYERRGTSLELVEDEAGLHASVVEEHGFAVRVFRSGRTSFAATGSGGALGLPAEARLLLARARTRRGARPAPALTEAPASPLRAPSPPDELAARGQLLAFRRALAAASDGAVLLGEASLMVGSRTERVATTAGRDVSFGSGSATLVAHVTARTGAGRTSARVVAAAARPEELALARLAHHAVDRVLLPLKGLPVAPGRWDLLLDPHVAAPLVARLAPAFFGEDEDGPLAARTRGGRDALASPAVTLVDAASAPGGLVRTTHDGEGTPQGRTVVLERGRLAARLTDVAAAARRGEEPTGNAVRRAFSEPPEIGITNLFVDPSSGVPPLDLLRALAKGFYAAVLVSRPDVDLAADRFALHVAGYWVERGRATDAVSETLLTGRLSELLRGIAAVGDDLKFVPAAGGGAGAPTVFVPKWKG
jgi:predicted Zn-dependent protease